MTVFALKKVAGVSLCPPLLKAQDQEQTPHHRDQDLFLHLSTRGILCMKPMRTTINILIINFHFFVKIQCQYMILWCFLLLFRSAFLCVILKFIFQIQRKFFSIATHWCDISIDDRLIGHQDWAELISDVCRSNWWEGEVSPSDHYRPRSWVCGLHVWSLQRGRHPPRCSLICPAPWCRHRQGAMQDLQRQ